MKTPLFRTATLTGLLCCAVFETQAQLKFDFESAELPPDTRLFGNAYLGDDGTGANSCLHLTDPDFNSFGQFLVPNVGNGKNVRQIDIQWRSLIGGGTGGGADGYSLNWANDLPETPDYAYPGEEGIGSGVTVTIDTFDNGGGEAPGIELRWKSNLVAFAPVPKDDPGSGLPFLRRNGFVSAQVTVDTKGLATFTYDTVSITAMLDGWKGMTGAGILLGARTGGGNDRHWVDNLQITTGLFSAGVFNGLFFEAGGIQHEHSGFVSLALTSRGTFSGYLLLAGQRYPLKGAFDLQNLSARLELPRPGSTTLTVDLTLANKDFIRGTVTDGIWVADLEADRQVWNKKGNPADGYVGRYTTVIEASSGASVPNGYGFGTVTVDPAGGVKFAGTLGDGSKATQKVAVSRNGRWPFYVSAYNGQGSIQGWLRINNMAERFADVVWTKKSGVPGPLYPNGFVVRRTFAVAPYSPPPVGTRIIDITTAEAQFGGGDLAAPFTSEFALTPDNKIVALDDDGLAISFTTKTGLFKGSVLEPTDGKKIKFAGVVYQPDNVAVGLIVGPTRTSSVIIDD
jgi:hypothetical protein